MSTNACSFWVRDRVPEHQHTWRYEGCHFTTTGYINRLEAAGTLPYGRAGQEPMAALRARVAELCGEAGATPIR